MENNNAPVWLITGGAGGLGAALAEQGAQRGARLVLLDRDRRGLERVADRFAECGHEAPGLYPLDLGGAAEADYAALAETVNAEFGRLDVLVHAAAQFGGLRPAVQTDAVEWLSELHANLGGPWLLTRALWAPLRGATSGRLVFCLHDLEEVGEAYWGAYGVAKAGMAILARQLAGEAGNTNIRVLAADPGPMGTPLRTSVWPARPPDDWPPPKTFAARLADWLCAEPGAAGLHELNPGQ